jgi:hypothetical protein
VAALGYIALAIVTILTLRFLGLDKAAQWATVVAPVVPPAMALLGWANSVARPKRPSTPDQLDDAALMVTREVQRQWRSEVTVRQLQDPAPLAVRWKATRLAVTARPELANTLFWRTDNMDQLARWFLRLPHPRLVILGEPGSGKTTVAVLLTLALCKHRKPDDAVPVLLSAASWDPSGEDLLDWVQRRLSEDHFPLSDTFAYGATAVAGLVADRRVLPVIDGLDELPTGRGKVALSAINKALRAGIPMVVTCRTTEFEATVNTADVVSAATVIEAQPVGLSDAIHFLKEAVAGGSKAQRWQPVFDELQHDRYGPLAMALFTPLMVSLARSIYSTDKADPGELIESSRFRTHKAIEDHLLGELIPALYAANQLRSGSRAGRWTSDLAERWWTFLAARLHKRCTRDLAWWELSVSGRSASVMDGVMRGLMLGIPVGLAEGLAMGVVQGIAFGLVGGLVILGVVAVAEPEGRHKPSQFVLRFDRLLRRHLIDGLLGGLGLGLVSGVTAGSGIRSELAIYVGAPLPAVVIHLNTLASLAVLGVLLGLAYGFWRGCVRVADQSPSPVASLHADRNAVVSTVVLVGSLFGLPIVGGGLVLGPGIGPALGLVVWLLVGLAAGSRYPWFGYQLARTGFAIKRQLPWRLMTFLEDGHRLGILRQVSSLYQFRHARLQDRLAGAADERRSSAAQPPRRSSA